MTKTEKCIKLLSTDIAKAQVAALSGCSLNHVYKTEKKYAGEIAALKGGSAVPSAAPTPSCMPKIDTSKPAAPQLEALAWSVLAEAAVGGDVSGKQISAAREIIKQAERDKAPPPCDRKFTFKLDRIDLVNEQIETVSTATYQVRP